MYLSRILRLSIFLYGILHFVTFFVDSELLADLQALSGLLILVFAGINLTLKQFKLPLFLFLTGLITITLAGDSFFENIQNGLLQMSSIIGLLIIVPMIGWVLREEPYIEEIIGLAHRMLDTSRKFYFGMIFFTHIISYFLLFGSIPLMYRFVDDILKNQQGEAWENFKGTALLRAFALSTLWIISIPSFTFAVEALNASLWVTILQGFVVTVCAIAMAVIFSYFDEKRYGVNLTSEIKTEIDKVVSHSSNRKQQIRNSLEFTFLFITLFGSIFILYEVLSIPLMVLIPLVIIVWTSIYFMIKKSPIKLFRQTTEYYREGLVSQGYQFSIMLAAGVMILGINQTGLGANFIEMIYNLQEIIPFFNMLYFLPFIVIILGFMGLGPLTVMVLVAGILESISLPYPPELVVLSITSGSAISILLSPLIMPVIILSGTNGLSGYKNGIKFNLKYAIALYVMVQIYVQFVVYNL
ncbi:hypothetical protein [Virgibacillus salinus]|uniref:DUF401 family protein n=1 Tax=Virgibacillus salinus TaxID=553311 RepID=A0A1H1DSL7_9BACI|nr:hypothetical protein [Virgibacillus salinus]SDQ78876.1 hypothetical protein SAMN05216231_2533 [Virgibacillus salinus]